MHGGNEFIFKGEGNGNVPIVFEVIASHGSLHNKMKVTANFACFLQQLPFFISMKLDFGNKCRSGVLVWKGKLAEGVGE